MQNNTFLSELNSFLQKAKYNHSDFALVFLENDEKDEENKDFNNKKHVFDNIKSLLGRSSAKIFNEEQKMQIILPDSSREKACEVIKNIQKYALENDLRIKSGFSIYPDDGITSEELFDFAQKPA